MKRLLTLALCIMLVLSGCSGGQKPLAGGVSPVETLPSAAEQAMAAAMARYEGTEETEADQALLAQEVRLSAEGLQAVEDYLAANIPAYPYGELIQLEDAYGRYLALERREDTPGSGFLSALPISGEEMLAHVKANNDAFLEVRTIENSVFRPLEDDYLTWVCQVVADTVNQELAEIDCEEQLSSIDWNLDNLKILMGSTPANASYLTGALMQVRASGVDGMTTITGNEMAAHQVITHEVEHLLQNMSQPAQTAMGVSQNYGFIYMWEDLPVNSLHSTWFIEASAERLASAFYDIEPATYFTMIGYLDSLTLPALLRDRQPLEVPRLSQQPYLETVFQFFDLQSEEEQWEFLNLLYAIQLIQITPDDFWAVYAAENGLDGTNKTDDDLAVLRKSLKSPVCLSLSRYFYRDLSRLLAEDGMTMRELFYLMSMWEFDLNGHILYDDETRLEDTRDFFTGYLNLQDSFFEALAPDAGLSAEEMREVFTAYLCRCEVPRRSLIYENETWTKGVYIVALSPEGNDFLDGFYETVSQKKTVPVYLAAEILLEETY